MKLEQRIIIEAEIAGEGNARDDPIEHPARSDAVEIAHVSGEADDPTDELIHHDDYPMAPERA